MMNIIGGKIIKKSILASMLFAMILTLFTGCGTVGNEASAPEATRQLTAAVDSDDNQAPEIRNALPIDLLSGDLNVFSDVSFPEGYNVYAAGFENNVNFYLFELYLTAEEKPEDIITYISNLLGLSTEESIRESLDAFHRNGMVTIFGTQVEGGLNADCDIKATKENDYDYDYVPGCTLRLRTPIPDASSYKKIIEDNYNLNSLSEIAAFFDPTLITGQSQIYVRKNRDNAQIDVVYNTIDDVAKVMERMKAALTYINFDESINIINLPNYGDVGNSIFFDLENNSISIFQALGDSGKNYKDYKTATTKLTDLGFQNYIEQASLCEFKDKVNNLNIVINIPQWGSRPDELENNCVMFFKEINGYLLAIWYYPNDTKYAVQADKDDTSAKYAYYVKTSEFDEEFPDPDTVRAYFEDVYNGVDLEDVYMESIELFQGYVNDTFGMNIDDLYALAASE
ncbi:MAG: hypothetical protein CVU87_05740 [Firmicutes bacterium HGW-Firmicutes-12]|nr:MAG: hypothetical protein CVU87_05740 [Firmicutes bacterium HGW-Firmicutes-12]